MKARDSRLEPVPFILLHLLPFLAGHNIKNIIVITKKTCRVLIVAVMGIRIKGELTGVRNLFLTPVLNFEGERPWLEPVPHYSYYKTNPQVDFVITNLWFALFIF